MMGEHRIECDGGPNCQATEHIHGCFAERDRWKTRAGVGKERIAFLERRLARAVEVRETAADLLRVLEKYDAEPVVAVNAIDRLQRALDHAGGQHG
jgi:hypothetical protein